MWVIMGEGGWNMYKMKLVKLLYLIRTIQLIMKQLDVDVSPPANFLKIIVFHEDQY